MKKLFFILSLLSPLMLFGKAIADSIPTQTLEMSADTSLLPVEEQAPAIVLAPDSIAEKPAVEWKPNPNKAVWYAAIVPGLGQIYNRKYWKLPIVYGGFLGCIYAITWNSGAYSDYKTMYRDIIDNDPNTNSYLDILQDGLTIERLGGVATFTRLLETRQNTYRRYRDLSIIVTVGVYALSIIDAFVDAQLYDFDISPDLSFQVEPRLYRNEFNNKLTPELMLTFKF